MTEGLGGTGYATASWHTLCSGGAGVCWARKPELAYFKWRGRWQSTAVALQYASGKSDPVVITPTVLPVWD